MMGEEEIPDRDDVCDDSSDEYEESYELSPDPRRSDVEEDVSLWDEDDFWRSPNWESTLTDDEKEAEWSSEWES